MTEITILPGVVAEVGRTARGYITYEVRTDERVIEIESRKPLTSDDLAIHYDFATEYADYLHATYTNIKIDKSGTVTSVYGYAG